MTVTRYRPTLENVSGTGTCTECGSHAGQLYPILLDGVEHILCATCRKEKGL